MKVVLTIAGSDSGGGAGIQGDLKTFEAHGVFGVTAITAITAQNSTEVRSVFDAPADIVRDQLETVFEGFPVASIKIGMLSNRAIVETVSAALERYAAGIPVVLDPVIASSSGRRLLSDDAIDALLGRLAGLCSLITPNAEEASILSGVSVNDRETMAQAARVIVDRGARAVLVKGGHAIGDDDEYVVDILFDGRDQYEFASPRLAIGGRHGTGCALSSAIAANLALGFGLIEAIEAGREYVLGAMRRSPLGEQENAPLLHRRTRR